MSRNRWHRWTGATAIALALGLPACSSDNGTPIDGSPMDSGHPEAQVDASGPGWRQSGLDGDIIFFLALDPKLPTRIFASATAGGADVGVFRSRDGGQTWTKLSGGLPTNQGGGALAVHPTQNLVLASVGSAGVFRSTDGGDTWTLGNSPGSDYGSFVFDPAQSVAWTVDSLYGVLRSADGGANWATTPNTGLPPLNTVTLGPMAFDGSTLYLATGGQGAFVSGDGMSWTAAGSGLPMGGVETTPNALTARASRPGVALALTNADGLFRTDNAGATWSMVNLGPLAPRYSALLIDPTSPTILYVSQSDTQGGTGGLLTSTDDGLTWSVLGPTIACRAMDVSPADGTVFVGTIGGGVWRYGL